MKNYFEIEGALYYWNGNQPLDISIPLKFNEMGPNCFYAPLPEANPVVTESFVGSTAQGGKVNFMNVKLNPHGNGTHTECVGHIANASYFINDCLKRFMYLAKVISVWPEKQDDGNRIITLKSLQTAFDDHKGPTGEALIVRTLPNEEDKCWRNYSGNNPVYFSEESINYIVKQGYKHLLTDLPSVDREEDGGLLKAHKAFWNFPDDIRMDATITELIFVGNHIKDGLYLLQMQIAPFQLDASPSKPTLYQIDRQGK